MRRAAPLFILLMLAASTEPVSAGGSWLEVREGPSVRMGAWDVAYASVGSTVTMRGTFSSGQQAPVSDGPWYAYLSPQTTSDETNVAPILLGSVDVSGDGYPYAADTTFVVPDVTAGRYWVQVCNLGCTQGVGDLIGGEIVIAATQSEARAFARSIILDWRHQADVSQIERLQQRQEALRATIERMMDAAKAADLRADEATERAAAADGQIASLESSLSDAERKGNIWRLVAGLAFLLSVFALAWIAVSRRRLRVLIPASPAELSPYKTEERPRAGTK